MPKTTLIDDLKKKLIKNALPAALGGVITTVSAYLVDRGLLDGEGADTLADLLLHIAVNAIGLVF